MANALAQPRAGFMARRLERLVGRRYAEWMNWIGRYKRCDLSEPFWKLRRIWVAAIAEKPKPVCIQRLNFTPLLSVAECRRPERPPHAVKLRATLRAHTLSVLARMHFETLATCKAGMRNEV